MNELKAIHAYTFDEVEVISTHSNGNDYYLKSEADKLIAELNMRICEGDEDFEIANNQINRLLKIVRHQKYKRCLAMAKYFDVEIGIADTDCDYEDMQWYQKWYGRWLELAKNFNPNNSTAHQCKGKQNG